jgi:uncharacterized iron-regulated membrane protein
MSRLRAALWGIRIAFACALTGFGVYLLVKAWGIPLEGGSALFTPMAFAGALLCFGLAVASVIPASMWERSKPQLAPRSGRPAAR